MTKALRKIVVIILSLIAACSIISLTTACKTKIKFVAYCLRTATKTISVVCLI